MRRVLTVVLFLAGLASPFFGGGSKEKTELIVAAAASLTDAMNELAALYGETRESVSVKVTYGSSGALQAQIEQGAPADLFMSASPKQMNALESQGLLLEGTRKDLLVNEVVLVVSPYLKEGIASFNDAAGPGVGRIALGDFRSVPAGQYAEQVFTSLGIVEGVRAKAVFAKDVRQVLAWVASGEADCGVVYATDAAASPGLKVAARAPEGSHVPVVYPAAVVASSSNPGEAKAFLAWLSLPEARSVFEKHGFLAP